MNIFGTSNWIFTCLFIIVGTIFIANLIFFTVRRFIHFSVLKKHHDFAGFIVGVFGVLYSVFLGFTIVNSQQNLNNIVLRVNEEAYLSESIFQSANVFPEKEKAKIQNKVMSYVKSIVEEEWPLMSKKMENPYTLIKLEKMWKTFYNFHPQTEQEKLWYAQSVALLLKQSSARLKRIYSTWESIGILPWLALIIGGIVLILFLFFFGTENTKTHVIIISLVSSYIAFMLFIVYSFDNPFRNPINVQPKAYQIIYNYDTKTKNSTISPEKETLLKSVSLSKNKTEK